MTEQRTNPNPDSSSSKSAEQEKTFLKGFLYIYIAQEMEDRMGWSVIEEGFVGKLPAMPWGIWNGQVVYDAQNLDREGVAIGEIQVLRGDTWISANDQPLAGDDVVKSTVKWNDGTVEERLTSTLHRYSIDLQGAYPVCSGDQITVYDKKDPNKIIYQGEIDLDKLNSGQEIELGKLFAGGNPVELLRSIASDYTDS